MLLPFIIFSVFVLCYIFFIPYKFVNFDLADRRSIVNSKRRTRKYGPGVLPPYPNGWFAIEQSRNIKPGTAKNVDCLGENFVVFRSKTNEVFVLDAYCPHMGVNIGVGGKVKGNCVECPLHSWRFSGETGECVDIPYSESCDDVKKQAKLRKWISKEVNGFIYVWYHAENEEPWEIPELNLNDQRIYYSWDIKIYSHIQEFHENGADQAHLKSLHTTSILAGKKSHGSWLGNLLQQNTINTWLPEPKNFYKSSVDTKFELNLFGKYKIYSLASGASVYGPGIFIFKIKSSFGDVTIINVLTPSDAYSYRMTALVYAPFWLSLFAKIGAYAFLVNLYRDKIIWDSKRFKKNPLLLKEEKELKRARVWFSKFYSSNSKTFEEARNSMEW